MSQNVFVTGGTGYMGSRLIPLPARRGHQVKTLVREGSKGKLQAGAVWAVENPVEGIRILGVPEIRKLPDFSR